MAGSTQPARADQQLQAAGAKTDAAAAAGTSAPCDEGYMLIVGAGFLSYMVTFHTRTWCCFAAIIVAFRCSLCARVKAICCTNLWHSTQEDTAVALSNPTATHSPVENSANQTVVTTCVKVSHRCWQIIGTVLETVETPIVLQQSQQVLSEQLPT